MDETKKEILKLRSELLYGNKSILKRKGFNLTSTSAYMTLTIGLSGFSKSRLTWCFTLDLNEEENPTKIQNCLGKLTKLKKAMLSAPHYLDSLKVIELDTINGEIANSAWKFYYYKKSDINNEEKIKLACLVIGESSSDIKCITDENIYRGTIDTSLPTSIRIELSLKGGRPATLTCPIGQGKLPDVFIAGYVNITSSSYLSIGVGILERDRSLDVKSDPTTIRKDYQMEDPVLDKRIEQFFSFKDYLYTKTEYQVFSLDNLDVLNTVLEKRLT